MMKRYFRSHRGCIESLIRHAWSDRIRTIYRGSICAKAHAYVLWRMFWERAYTPYQLSAKQRATKLRKSVDWSTPSYDHGLTVYRLFALECLAVLDECLLLAERSHRQRTFSFSTSQLKQTRLPYWVIQVNGDHSTSTHWWPCSAGRQPFPIRSTARIADRKPCGFKPSKWRGFF